jgi:hypothetical protein
MLFQRRAWLYSLALVLGVALATTPARAAEIDKYLPDDTEAVVTINVKQIIDSPLFKKYALDVVQQGLKDNDEVSSILKDLGFDPLKDADTIMVAGPSGDETDKGLIIMHGRIDVAKFKTKAEEAAKANGEHLKIHKRENGPAIYEVTHDNLPSSMFVAVVDKNTILASFGKDYVVDALKKIDAKQATVKSKEIKALLEKLDGKQSISFAMIGSAAAKSKELAQVIPGDVLDNLDAVGAGVTVADDIKLEVGIVAKTADSAKSIREKIDGGLNQALGTIAGLAQVEKNFQPAVDVIKSVKTTQKDKTVTLQGEVTAEQLEKLAKAVQGFIPK